MATMLRAGVRQWRLGRGAAWPVRTKKSSSRRRRDEAAMEAKHDEAEFDADVHVRAMAACIERLEHGLRRLRTSAAPDMLDRVTVEAYGARNPLKALAQVALKDGKTLAVDVFDHGVISNVENAIRSAGLGLNPSTNGSPRILVPVPRASGEKRAELCKVRLFADSLFFCLFL
mmetsp:Transcript_4953/g.12044  ORF Transcript_4953/g.12044 Transcript_4953/m.12044 type:complete len:173 (-) Transcript_4953:425-943(-)